MKKDLLSEPSTANPHCPELWANAYDHQAKINYWLPGLKSQINSVKSQLATMELTGSQPDIQCDVALQIVAKIEEINNLPLVEHGTPPPLTPPA